MLGARSASVKNRPCFKENLLANNNNKFTVLNLLRKGKNKHISSMAYSVYALPLLSDIFDLHIFHWEQSGWMFKIVTVRYYKTLNITDIFHYATLQNAKT